MEGIISLPLLATFIRVIHEQNLHIFFSMLPLCLLVVSAFRRNIRETNSDPADHAMFTGALVGVLAGFLSAATDYRSMHLPWFVGDPQWPLYVRITNCIELLHIPVTMYLLIKYCDFTEVLQFGVLSQKQKSKILSVATCSSFMMSSILFLTWRPMPLNIPECLLGCFLICFTASISFVVDPTTRPVLVCLCSMTLNLWWQITRIETSAWNLGGPRFPVPGFLIGIILAMFNTDYLSDQKDNSLSPGCEEAGTRSNQEADDAGFWMVICYNVERLSLGMYEYGNKTDNVVSGIMLLFTWLTMSDWIFMSMDVKIAIVMLSLMVYVQIGMVQFFFTNGYLIDIILGLALFYTVRDHRRRQRSRWIT